MRDFFTHLKYLLVFIRFYFTFSPVGGYRVNLPFLFVLALSAAAVWLGGGTAGFLWPVFIAAALFYTLAIAIWDLGYLLAAVGLALSAVGYITSVGPHGVFSPYFAYLTLLSWVVWRLGGGELARLMGGIAAVTQIIIDGGYVFGRWSYIPLLALAYIPLIRRGPRPSGRYSLLLIPLAAGLLYGFLKLLAGPPSAFLHPQWALAAVAVSCLLLAGFATSVLKSVGGLLVGLALYLIAVFFLPVGTYAPLFLLAGFAVALGKRAVPLYVFLAGFALFLYFTPALLVPTYNATVHLASAVSPSGEVRPADAGVIALRGGRYGFNGEVGLGRFTFLLRIQGVEKIETPLVVDLKYLNGGTIEKTLFIFPHIVFIRIRPGVDTYATGLACIWGYSLGVGCSTAVSFDVDVVIYINTFLYALLWFIVVAAPLAIWRLSTRSMTNVQM